MKIVVTGAGGFSGSYLVKALLGRGHNVIAVTSRGRGRLALELEKNPALTVTCGDLSQPIGLPEQVDAIVHAAARSPAPGITAADLVRDNAEATKQLIAYAGVAGARIFIYLSSLSIYGEIAGPTVDETTPIIRPDPYGMTKYLGETMLKEARLPLRSLSLRLPGIIGPMSVRNWLTNVAETAKAGRLISYYNPATPFNNAVHVDDLARFTIDILESPTWDGHDVVTVASAGMTTVGQAVELIVKGLGSSSALKIVSAPRPGFTVSIERAQARYGYNPMQIESALARFATEFSG